MTAKLLEKLEMANALINAGFYRQNGEGFNEDIHLYDNPYKPIIEVVIH